MSIEKIKYYTNCDSYVNPSCICAWCKSGIYVGLRVNDVPEDLTSCFLSPQDYERYEKIVGEF